MNFFRRSLWGRSLLLAVAAVALGTSRPLAAEEASPAEVFVAPFYAEVSPPMGHPLCGGWITPALGVDDPELAKGIVLKGGDQIYVLCSIDWCEVRNETYDLLRQRIALAAGTTPHQVAVHTVHQHNAPLMDTGAQRLLDTVPEAPLHADYDYLDQVAGNIAVAVEKACRQMIPVTQIGTGQAEVEKVAASRRVLQEDGTILVRWSSTKDAVLQEAPEGNIDRFLKTLSFYNRDQPIVRLHYYATHPQSYYGDGRTTYDFPGIARHRLEKESGVFQIYFTGCAGDVTAGKYNDGSPSRRYVLADRLYEGMVRSVSSTVLSPVGQVTWKTRDILFPLRQGEEFEAERLEQILHAADSNATQKLKAALDLNWTRRMQKGIPIELSCLSIGPVKILHLPGEPMIEFQHEAQRVGGEDRFVAVAGYGDCGMGYICTAEAFTQGGYEPTASLAAPESEHLLKEAIRELLTE